MQLYVSGIVVVEITVFGESFMKCYEENFDAFEIFQEV